MAIPKPIVEVHQAWMWDCPDCGTENFERSVTADLTREEAIELAKDIGELDEFSEVPENYSCDFVTAPIEVHCRQCAHIFDVEIP